MNYTTQMDAARKGILTKELLAVAKKEQMDPENLVKLVAAGQVVIPANKCHTCLDPNGIGSVTAMIRAGRAANRKGIPIIFDPVGIGVSAHRRYAARQILSHMSVSIVRGNSSEIRTLANLLGDPVEKEQHEVDAVSVQMPDTHASSDSMNAAKTIVPKSSTASKQSDSSNIPRKFSSAPHSISERLRTDTRIARCLSKKLRAVIVCTGPCDLVVCGSRTARIHNGCPELAQITGSGCMMDGLLAAFVAAISTRITRKEAFPAQQALTAAYLPTAVKNLFKTSAKHPTLYQEKHSSFATSIGLQTPFIYFHSAPLCRCRNRVMRREGRSTDACKRHWSWKFPHLFHGRHQPDDRRTAARRSEN